MHSGQSRLGAYEGYITSTYSFAMAFIQPARHKELIASVPRVSPPGGILAMQKIKAPLHAR